MTYYIYVLTSPSGKKYVGQTSNVDKRFIHYKKCLCYGQTKLYKALVKYGFETFDKEIIQFENITKEEVSEKEIFYIKENDSFLNGYNCSIGGEYAHQKYYTEEERNEAERKRASLWAKQYRENNKEKFRLYRIEYNKRPEAIVKRKKREDKRRERRNIQRNLQRKENLELFRRKEQEYRLKKKNKQYRGQGR